MKFYKGVIIYYYINPRNFPIEFTLYFDRFKMFHSGFNGSGYDRRPDIYYIAIHNI